MWECGIKSPLDLHYLVGNEKIEKWQKDESDKN
jgi:hypothetical protein